jgi:hypothetical protein
MKYTVIKVGVLDLGFRDEGSGLTNLGLGFGIAAVHTLCFCLLRCGGANVTSVPRLPSTPLPPHTN